MKLLVMNDYRSNRASYQAGQVIEVDEKQAAWLMGDAPGVFVAYKGKNLDAPPADKMIKRAPRKK